MKKFYLVTVVAQCGDVARVWATTLVIDGVPDMMQVAKACVAKSRTSLPPAEGWRAHTCSSLLDISQEALAFAQEVSR